MQLSKLHVPESQDVVSDEVKQPAQRASETTSDIEKSIIEVQGKTLASVQAMQNCVSQVNSVLKIANEAGQILSDMQQQANNSLVNVLDVVHATTSQVATIEEINSSVPEVACMAKDSHQCLNNNATQANLLDQLSSTLKNDINTFTVLKINNE